MKNFKERILQHLSEYKANDLGISEMGIYRRNGREYSHILPDDKAQMNLLELVRPFYTTLEDTRGRKIKWHSIAHLNSSQVLAINLFEPFLTTPERKRILAGLLDLDGELTEAGFEHVPDPAEGTNVDFYAKDERGNCLLIEVKFTESRFGDAKDDDEHKKKYEEIYRERLTTIARFEGDAREEFLAAYQFFRNAIHAGRSEHGLTRVWFLVPRENELMNVAAQEAMTILKEEAVQHIAVVYLEDLLSKIERLVSEHTDLKVHYSEFRRKYLLPT